MSYRLVAVGKLKSAEAELYQRYAKRLGRKLTLKELSDKDAGKIGQYLQLRSDQPLIVLDERGKDLSTTELHDWIAARNYSAEFAIGGADGLPDEVRQQAQLVLRLGKLTWPHQLARVLLTEQLYRVESVRAGHPYHREG